MYDSSTNTKILTRRLYVCSALSCLLRCLFSYVVNGTILKTVNFDERFESFESFLTHHHFYSSHSHTGTTRVMLLLISTLHNSHIYTNHKISMIRVRTLKHLLEGCMFTLLAALLCLVCLCVCFLKTVNFDERFESFESFLRVVTNKNNKLIYMINE